jgi:hypothetical protein
MHTIKNDDAGSPLQWTSGFFMLALLFLFACDTKMHYDKLEARELASGIRNDSLFLGLYFGMTRDSFYAHCWKLYERGVMKEGMSGNTIYYPLKTFKYPASMDFFPLFHKEKIVSLPITLRYDSWAPWHKHLFASELKKEAAAMIKEWYGGEFIKVKMPTAIDGHALAKVDGNRRIRIYCTDDTKVHVDFVDLTRMEHLKVQ